MVLVLWCGTVVRCGTEIVTRSGVVLRRTTLPLFQTVAWQKLPCCHGDRHHHHLFSISMAISTNSMITMTRMNLRLSTSSCTPPCPCFDSKLQMESLVKRCLSAINISSSINPSSYFRSSLCAITGQKGFFLDFHAFQCHSSITTVKICTKLTHVQRCPCCLYC